MKAVADRTQGETGNNFFLSTLETVNNQEELRFRAIDAVMVIVLILEVAVIMRLFLAR